MDFLGVNAQLLGGFKYTLLIFFITLVAAIPLGLPIALGSMSPCAGSAALLCG